MEELSDVKILRLESNTLLFELPISVSASSSLEEVVLRIRWTRSNASKSSASVCSWKASRLDRTVPEKRTGSWGMIARRLLRS